MEKVKTALITGANRGIGLATVKKLAGGGIRYIWAPEALRRLMKPLMK